jgi:predicted naringenin-chalcone synthase
MTWRIGDQGFDIALSSYVPKLIGSNIRELVGPALAAGGRSLSDVDTWAVHPGGKSIIDQVQRTLGLSVDQVSASREVLRRCGNMSSATILFVLEEILNRPSGIGRSRVCAVAFGPGLTVEMATLEAIFAPDAAARIGFAAAVPLSPA